MSQYDTAFKLKPEWCPAWLRRNSIFSNVLPLHRDINTLQGWAGDVLRVVLHSLESRRVSLAGITRHADQAWVQQMARNATGEAWGFLDQRRYTLHDRDNEVLLTVPREAKKLVV
jgi:hypothetical protein